MEDGPEPDWAKAESRNPRAGNPRSKSPATRKNLLAMLELDSDAREAVD